MEKGTIAICFVDAVLDGVRARGLDPHSLLEACSISPDLLAQPRARVSAPAYAALLRLIAQTLDDEFFGQDSRRMKAGSFAMLCHAVLPCKTMGRALSRTLRFFALLLDDLTGRLVEDGTLMHLVLAERFPDRPPRIFAQENLLLFVHRLTCWLVNRRIPIEAAAFRYPEPAHAGEYPVLFCKDIAFGQPATRLTFQARYADLPVVRNETSLKDFLKKAPENLLVRYSDSHSLALRIRRRLNAMPPAEWPSFDDVAREFGASLSTMRRRLDQEGQSYQRIKDGLRRDRAIGLLTDQALSVMDIASELGFAEPSAFHRAFRKWTGVNPGEYRRTAMQKPPV